MPNIYITEMSNNVGIYTGLLVFYIFYETCIGPFDAKLFVERTYFLWIMWFLHEEDKDLSRSSADMVLSY